MKSIHLSTIDYHTFLEGQELEYFADKRLSFSLGEHVMIYKNTVAALSDVSLPESALQADAIGIEAMVTAVDNVASRPNPKLKIKKYRLGR